MSCWWNPGGSLPVVQAYQAVGTSSYEDSLLDLSGNGYLAFSDAHPPIWTSGNGWILPGYTVAKVESVKVYHRVCLSWSGIVNIAALMNAPRWWVPAALGLVAGLLALGAMLGT